MFVINIYDKKSNSITANGITMEHDSGVIANSYLVNSVIRINKDYINVLANH